MLIGGTATFQVRWFAGTTELRGNGALAVSGPSDVTATTPQTFLFEERDWLQVSPIVSGGPATLVISAGGNPVRTFTVDRVDPSQVASIRIRGVDESKARKGQWLVALAEGLDASSTTILGIEYSWDLDGAQQLGLGDLYRYQFDPAVPKMLTATFGGNQASAPIHWGGGFVDSSNNIGCSVGPGAPRAPVPLLLIVIAGMLARAWTRLRRRA